MALIGVAGTLLAGILPRFLDQGAERRKWMRDMRLERHGAFFAAMHQVLHEAGRFNALPTGSVEQKQALTALLLAKRDFTTAFALLGLVSGPEAFQRAQAAQAAVSRDDLFKLDPESDDYKAVNEAMNAYGNAAVRDIPR